MSIDIMTPMCVGVCVRVCGCGWVCEWVGVCVTDAHIHNNQVVPRPTPVVEWGGVELPPRRNGTASELGSLNGTAY